MFQPTIPEHAQPKCKQCGNPHHGDAAKWTTLNIPNEASRMIKVCDKCQCEECLTPDEEVKEE